MPRVPLQPEFARFRERHGEIFVIVSPPRCSSTALARVFWEHPRVRYYCHEPFEVTYYQGESLAQVEAKIDAPLDLERLKCFGGSGAARALVIKEMPYQVGEAFPVLAGLATRPLVFLMRDPRLNIASRMAKKREVGDDPIFPAVESGWELLWSQVEWCRGQELPHLLIDSTDFRNRPLQVLPRLFETCGLVFDAAMLEWRTCPEVELDNLGGRHRHLYGQVLESDGIRSDMMPIPPLESFPAEHGWRDHVSRCLEIYRDLAGRDERIRAPGSVDAPLAR